MKETHCVYRTGSLASAAAATLFNADLTYENIHTHFYRRDEDKERVLYACGISTRHLNELIERTGAEMFSHIHYFTYLRPDVRELPTKPVVEIHSSDRLDTQSYHDSLVSTVFQYVHGTVKNMVMSDMLEMVARHEMRDESDPERLRRADCFALGFRNIYGNTGMYNGFKDILTASVSDLDHVIKPLDTGLQRKMTVDALIEIGSPLLRRAETFIEKAFQEVGRSMVPQGAFSTSFGTRTGRIPLIRLPRAMVSLIPKKLIEPYSYVALYEERGGWRKVELRSAYDDSGILEFALSKNGGGRPRACGFSQRVEQDEELG